MTDKQVVELGDKAISRIPTKNDFLWFKIMDNCSSYERYIYSFVFTFDTEEVGRNFMNDSFPRWLNWWSCYCDYGETSGNEDEEIELEDGDFDVVVEWSGKYSELLTSNDDVPKILRSAFRKSVEDSEPEVLVYSALPEDKFDAFVSYLKTADNPLEEGVDAVYECAVAMGGGGISMDSIVSYWHFYSDSCMVGYDQGEFVCFETMGEFDQYDRYLSLAMRFKDELMSETEYGEEIWTGKFSDLMNDDDSFPKIVRMFYRYRCFDSEDSSPIPTDEQDNFASSLYDFAADGAGMASFRDYL
jgi:hypothetical protein